MDKNIKLVKKEYVSFEHTFEKGDKIILYEKTPMSEIHTEDDFIGYFDGDKRDLPKNWEYTETEGAGIWYITVK